MIPFNIGPTSSSQDQCGGAEQFFKDRDVFSMEETNVHPFARQERDELVAEQRHTRRNTSFRYSILKLHLFQRGG